MKKETQPKNKNIILKLKYRDEVCRHCGDTFRAGEACEGYMDWNVIGYSSVGLVNRKGRHGFFCNVCMEEFVYRFMGESSLFDHERAPSKMYSLRDFRADRKSRVSGMMIKGAYKKYNKKKFEKEVKRFVKWVKKNEPWNTVNYEKFSGYKK